MLFGQVSRANKMMNKLIWPVAVVLATLVLVGGFWMIQSNKQDSIEKQVKDKAAAEQTVASTRQVMLSICLQNATDARWEYIKINGTENTNGSVTAAQRFFDYGDKIKKDATDLCFKRY